MKWLCRDKSALSLGLGCSTGIEHSSHNQQIVGLNLSGCRAFLIPQWSVLNQIPQGGASQIVCSGRQIMDAQLCCLGKNRLKSTDGVKKSSQLTDAVGKKILTEPNLT